MCLGSVGLLKNSGKQYFTQTNGNTLRSRGIRVVIYLDDILLLHQVREELSKIFRKVLELLQSSGFTIKLEKCSSAPAQSLVFLGGLVNSVEMTISLPPEKLNGIVDAVREILKAREVTASFILTPWSVESCSTNRDLDCTPSLQEHSATTYQDGSPSIHRVNSYPS